MNSELRNKYGYPIKCNACQNLEPKPKNIAQIDPFYKSGKGLKLLLIGQDPTIFNKHERVNTVLMLNENSGRNGQLRKWVENELFGKENFNQIEIYATNLVKCQFEEPPSASQDGALKFLTPRFEYCKQYLFKEFDKFKPDIVLTLGESTHKLFFKEIEVLSGSLVGKMKDDFTGNFIKVRLNNIEFYYSPCLHIKTYRVAETYGKQVFDFKEGLNKKISATNIYEKITTH